jgi:hypothetical protein
MTKSTYIIDHVIKGSLLFYYCNFTLCHAVFTARGNNMGS